MSEEEYLSLFEGAAPGQLRGEASSSYLWSPSRPPRHRGGAPGRAHHRDHPRAGELPALAAPAAAAEPPTSRARLPRGGRARPGPAAKAGMIPSRSYWPSALIYSDRVRYVEQLRRYHEVFPPRADAGADLRRLPRRQRRRRCARCCASSRSRRTPIEPRRGQPHDRPPVRARKAGGALRRGAARCARAGAAPARRSPRRRMRATLSTRSSARAVLGRPPPADEELMAELRRRFKPRGRGAERVPGSATSSRCGAMTTSTEAPATDTGARPARLLHRRAPQERHHGAVRDAQAPPAALHARLQGAELLRGRPAPPRPPPAARAGDARGVPRAVRAGAAPDQLAGEASPSYLRSADRRGEIAARCSRTRASSRSCASPRASCARCTCSCCRTRREQKDLRRASRSRPSASERTRRCTARSRCYSDHVRYVEQLRRYQAVFAPEQVLVLIYDDFRATTPPTVRSVLRFLGSTTRRRSRPCRPTPRRGALAAARRDAAQARRRRGPLARAPRAPSGR